MKIFLDDATEEYRPTPTGYTRCRWPAEVIALLDTEEVTELSLDHDLGDKEAAAIEGRKEITGYDVVVWIEEQVALNGMVPPAVIKVHSSNGPGIDKMRAGIEQIYKLANK